MFRLILNEKRDNFLIVFTLMFELAIEENSHGSKTDNIGS
jgi:hypothetical protein